MPTYIDSQGYVIQTGKNSPVTKNWIGIKAVHPHKIDGAVSIYTSRSPENRDEVIRFSSEEELLADMVENGTALRTISVLPDLIRGISGIIKIPEFDNEIKF